MRLSTLAAEDVPSDPEITGVSEDSRKIRPGMVFVAVPGSTMDGHDFIGSAVANGAAAIVAERDVPGLAIPVLRVGSARVALADFAARFHGHPAKDLHVIGFTGTFGKTSTSDILRRLLDAAGHRSGVLGSLGARYGSFERGNLGLTTPAPVELHAALRGLRDAGANTVIMEVTSHALRMERARGLAFAGGLLAAIMPGEHTDFHRTYEDYVNAKRLFLSYLREDAVLAYDADNRAARQLASEARVRTTAGTVGFENVELSGAGARFVLRGVEMRCALMGRGHLKNVALAVTYALAVGVPIETIRDVLPTLTPLRRRMERYEVAGRTVLDDTAAHPQSFRATFETAQVIPHARATAIYAIRGSRGADINRRNASALADLALEHGIDPLIVTASEDATGPHDLVTDDERETTLEAIAARGRSYVFEPTLEQAVKRALEATAPEDLLLLLGAQGMDRGRELLSSAGSS